MTDETIFNDGVTYCQIGEGRDLYLVVYFLTMLLMVAVSSTDFIDTMLMCR